ncbi:MAG: electron transfer flavoprotein subunit beta/FixA family protein [Endomicrobium sp.]|jgi:electron transfer flavoprotein beta subunit|nr:electron transfer flavoprotein subunit beta/FixA family protein [Endomicrobium sp.]
MNIVICIKQVSKLIIESTINTIDSRMCRVNRETAKLILNPFDKYVIEESVRIKEKMGGKVTAITMGPYKSESILRKAISKGVDEAFLISDIAFKGSDALATSYVLSCAIKHIRRDYDIIICGTQSLDGDTGQVGPSIAEMLDIPHISYVSKIESIDIDKKTIKVIRKMEDGYDIIRSSIPVLLTVVKGINTPRMTSFKSNMISKKAKVKILNAFDINADIKKIGLRGSPTKVAKLLTISYSYDIISKKSTEEETCDQIIDILIRRLFNMKII